MSYKDVRVFGAYGICCELYVSAVGALSCYRVSYIYIYSNVSVFGAPWCELYKCIWSPLVRAI